VHHKRQLKIPEPKGGSSVAWPDNSRYNWANLPAIRAVKGVGRPPLVAAARAGVLFKKLRPSGQGFTA